MEEKNIYLMCKCIIQIASGFSAMSRRHAVTYKDDLNVSVTHGGGHLGSGLNHFYFTALQTKISYFNSALFCSISVFTDY